MSDGDKPSSTWKLPEGIEDHIEAGIFNTALGTVAGGLLGLAIFRSGGGWRAASTAAGAGIGIGSTVQRAQKMLGQQ